MAERIIKVKLVVDAPASNDTAAKRTAEGLDDVAKKADKGGASLISFGTILKTALVAGAAIATKSMLDLGMSYEKSLNQLQAVSGASADQLAAVSSAAKQLGNDISLPGASASDAAEAMTELAKGGLSVQEAMSAAKGTLQLAAAAQIDGAQAAEIQSAALNTFGLEAADAGRVADVLANAANASSGEITDFAQGLAQSGLAAKAMGISVEDTATTLALFANNGLSGSDAGTSFKTMLISLTNPSDKAAAALEELGVKAFDSSGKFVGMRVVTEQLSAAQKTMTTEQFNAAAATAFGTDALRAAVAVAESGVEGYDSMSTAIGKTGGAADLAAANSKGLAGAVDLVKNAAETAALGLYEQLSPALDQATRGIADMVPQVADALLPALEQAGTALISLVDILAPLVPVIGDALASAVSAAAAALGALAPVIDFAVTALSGVLGVITDLPGPILAAAGAFAILATAAPFVAIVGYIGGIVTAARAAVGAMASIKAAMAAAFAGPGMPVILAAAAVATVIGLIVAANESAAEATAAYKAKVDDLTGTLDENTGAITKNTRASIAKDIGTDRLRELEQLGVSTTDYTDAILGNVAAQGRVDAALHKSAVSAIAADKTFSGLADSYAKAGLTAADFADAALTGDYSSINAAIVSYNTNLRGAAGSLETFNSTSVTGSKLIGEFRGAVDGQARAFFDLGNQTKLVQDAQGNWQVMNRATTGSVDELTFSVKGADQAMGPLLAAIKDARGGGPIPNPISADTVPSIDTMNEALGGIKDAASAAETSVAFLQIQLDKAAGRAPDVEAAARAAQGAIRGYTEAYLGQGEATRDVTQAQINLSEAQNKAVEENYTLEQKTLDVAAAQDALFKAQNGVADSSDSLFEAGQKVYQSYLQQAQAAYDTAVANGDLLGAQEASRLKAQQLREDFIKANAALYGSEAAAGAVADSLGLIPADVSTQISQNGASAVELAAAAVKRALDAIPAVTTAQIRTINTTQFVTTGGVGATFADGGITKGGVRLMADGGITAAANGLMRQAMIARGGSNILWAEDETQGESYVPHAISKRKRSQEIMAKTAAIFGDTYVVNGTKFMANGGFSGGSAPAAPVIVKEFPLTIVNQSVPLTADGLRRIQREAERLNA